MHNLLKSNKAQFFILTAFVIITVVFFVSKWMEPSTVIDNSSVVVSDEAFIFNNIVEKAKYSISTSANCEDLNFNLQEYKQFAEQYVLTKGYDLGLNYTVGDCNGGLPITVILNISLISKDKTMEKNLELSWTS